MRIVLLLISSILVHASLLDFMTLDKAKEAYTEERYDEAAGLYESLADDENSEILFNLGDTQYRQGKFEEALKSFEKVTAPGLQHKKLHNMGNAYANLKRTEEAISAYEKALELEQDPDTQHNLDLLKKQDEQQQDDQNSQKDQDKESQDKDQGAQRQDRDQDGENDQESSDRQAKERQEQQKEEQAKSAQEQKQEDERRKEEEASAQQADVKKTPISDMEERKYEQMLDQRGVNTLMLPIDTKGEDEDEQRPW